MRRPSNIPFNGALNRAFKQVWDAIDALKPQSAPGILTSHTTRGTIRRPITRPHAAASSSITPMYIVSQTREWVKCWTQEQMDTEEYSWVAKPFSLRSEVAVTAETYPAVNWSNEFQGDKFIYRNPVERLRRTAAGSGLGAAGLVPISTGYEHWQDGVNYDDWWEYITEAYTTAPDQGLQWGAVNWFWDIEMVHPSYNLNEGAPQSLVAVPLPENMQPAEVPDDPSFASGGKYLDLNIDVRSWRPKHEVRPRRVYQMTVKDSPGWVGLRAGPIQFNNQLWGNTNPTLKFHLQELWPELQP